MTNRRDFFALSAAALSTVALPARAAVPMHVHAAPSCGCCHAWADLARARGYAMTVSELVDPDAEKTALGVPLELASCHTVEAGGYVFERHVPFEALEAVPARPAPTSRGSPCRGCRWVRPAWATIRRRANDVIAFGGAAGAGRVFYRAGTAEPFAG